MDRHSIREDTTSVDTASYGVGDMEYFLLGTSYFLNLLTFILNVISVIFSRDC
jgi:hypothetical protein